MAPEQSEAFAVAFSPRDLKEQLCCQDPLVSPLYWTEYLFQVFICHLMQTIMWSDFIFHLSVKFLFLGGNSYGF